MADTAITLGLWNYPAGGWTGTRHDLAPAVEHLAQATATAPDILGWPAADRYLDDGSKTLYQAANLFSDLLPHSESYVPFVSDLDGPVLFVNRAVIHPERWFPPHQLGSHPVQRGWLRATVAGVAGVWLSCQHWAGNTSKSLREQSSLAVSHVGKASILLGDLRQSSGWAGETQTDPNPSTLDPPDRGRRQSVLECSRSTSGVDLLGKAGYRDLGELAGDPTPTSNSHPALRTTRILVGTGLHARLATGSYQVHPGTAIATRYVTATLLIPQGR